MRQLPRRQRYLTTYEGGIAYPDRQENNPEIDGGIRFYLGDYLTDNRDEANAILYEINLHINPSN